MNIIIYLKHQKKIFYIKTKNDTKKLGYKKTH